jgi:phycocyanobilin:ferredoxin oxidoreductase
MSASRVVFGIARGDAARRVTAREASTSSSRVVWCPRRRRDIVLAAMETWRSDLAPEGVIRDAAEAFVERWRASGATPSASIDASMVSLRPREGAEAKLYVENAVFESETFRKMHCELAWGDGGFQVLHVVVYPWAERAAPVFAADVVGFGGRISLCIADVAPVTEDLSLPPMYVDALKPLLDETLRGDGLSVRELPDWGRAILGPLCLCVGPRVGLTAEEETARFFDYAFQLHDRAAELASDASLALPPGDDSALRAQIRFCDLQLRNQKTRKALERAFGPEVADAYMRDVLFDVTVDTPTAPPSRR